VVAEIEIDVWIHDALLRWVVSATRLLDGAKCLQMSQISRPYGVAGKRAEVHDLRVGSALATAVHPPC
jgi:hypothetical protein